MTILNGMLRNTVLALCLITPQLVAAAADH